MLLAAHYGTVASAGGAQPRYVFAAEGTSPYIEAYSWSSGWGTKYSNPATLPTGAGNTIAVTGATDAVAVAHNTAPFVTAYPWTSSGFGTKYSNPATAVLNNGAGISWQPGDANIVIGNRTTTVYVQAYQWTLGAGFGTRYAQPATTTANGSTGMDWGTSYIARSNSGSTNIEAFLWSSGWSTRFTKAETASVASIRWATNGAADVAWTPSASPYIRASSFSAAGFGATYANPATLPTGSSNDADFSANGDQLAVAHGTSPFVTAYPFSSGFGTKYADPTTLPAGTGQSVAIYGEVLVVGHSTSPYYSAYGWSSTGFGGKYADPATLPTTSPVSTALGV